MSSAEELAGQFKGSRQQFAEIFDEISARNDGLLFKTLTRNLADDHQAFVSALNWADGQGWMGLFRNKSIAAGLVVSNNITTTNSIDQKVQQQAITSVTKGFFTMEEFNRGIHIAEKRVCKVLVDRGNVAKGTGFLVGPQTILTAWHVVASLIEANGEPSADSEKELTVEFDVSLVGDDTDTKYEAAANWLLAGSPHPPAANPDADGLLKNRFLDDDTNLDFALIRLKGTPGDTRGHYKVRQNLWPDKRSPLIVCQHPSGLNQRFAISDGVKFTNDDQKTRILHDANALPGSSGGLCLNTKFQPVALHQFALLDENDKVISNGGVPIANIAPFLAEAEQVDLQYYKLSHLPNPDKHPVIGRQKFQEAVWAAKKGDKPIIRVQGLKKSGKTFSVDILMAMLGNGDDLFVSVPAANMPAEARELARIVLKEVELPETHIELPSREDSDTSEGAWQEEILWPVFSSRLSDAINGRNMWLIFDDLNHVVLPNTGVRNFLELLYRNVSTIPGLRIVLVGLDVKVPAAVSDKVYSEQTLAFERSEIAHFLGLCYESKDYQADKSELQRMSSLIQKGAGDHQDVTAVADFVRDIVVPALKLKPE